MSVLLHLWNRDSNIDLVGVLLGWNEFVCIKCLKQGSAFTLVSGSRTNIRVDRHKFEVSKSVPPMWLLIICALLFVLYEQTTISF